MKRYLLFAGSEHYPHGGWSDFKGDYSTLHSAKKAANALREDWWHIVDTKEMKTVESFYQG